MQKVAETFSSYANEETIEAYLSYLDENNYVIRWGGGDSDSYVNLSSLQKEIWMEEHVPYGATIELTSRCNFRCVHCYLDHFHQTEDLTFDQIKFILDALAKAGMMTIFFSGGEPLLQVKAITELAKELKEYDLCMYTGMSVTDVPDELKGLLHYLKVGSFQRDSRTTVTPYIGSTNQLFIDLRREHETINK